MAMIFLALGLVLIVEGLAYVLAPSLVERLLQMMRQLGLTERRQIGAMGIGLGLILLWIAHLLGA
ncbi:MAG: DUF2065 domain-containing protein [Rhodobacteraceae bacterium]|nr:DUF2065 domain-containing protein [Paracoccaceae bacterium]